MFGPVSTGAAYVRATTKQIKLLTFREPDFAQFTPVFANRTTKHAKLRVIGLFRQERKGVCAKARRERNAGFRAAKEGLEQSRRPSNKGPEEDDQPVPPRYRLFYGGSHRTCQRKSLP
jgi:hypothetical protein